MAQNDVIDLDKMLDEYQAGLLVNPGVAQTQRALQMDLQKLAEFGYVKP